MECSNSLKKNGVLQLALAPLVVGISWYLISQVECSSLAINAYKQYLADEVFPWVIGCNVIVKLFVEMFYLVCRKLPTYPGLSTLPANIEIYIGTALDVLVCYVSLLRINLSYLYLAIFPIIAISFILVLCMRHNRLSGRGEVKSESSRTGTESTDNRKKAIDMPKPSPAALLSPHFLLCGLGMLGDPDHDGNNYDISLFFLFLTCMLLQLTIMMMRLPAGISRGITPASKLLRKASLVLMLLTAHMVAIDTFGREVFLLLLPEVVPLLLWFSLHLDRPNPVINVEKIMDSGHFVLPALVGAISVYILGVPTEESSSSRFYWACHSCAASGLITYIIALVLRLWPAKFVNGDTLSQKQKVATLSYEEAMKLLQLWGSVLLKASVGLLAFGGRDEIYRSVSPK